MSFSYLYTFIFFFKSIKDVHESLIWTPSIPFGHSTLYQLDFPSLIISFSCFLFKNKHFENAHANTCNCDEIKWVCATSECCFCNSVSSDC